MLSIKQHIYLLLATVTLATPCLSEKFKRSEVLDHNGKYSVEWEVDLDTETIEFTVTAETKGYVGFGISMNPSMAGADIIMGGVNADQSTYFGDYHAPANGRPQLDQNQNWHLLSATETNSHTILRFSRKLDTCDKDEDVAITADTQYIIWALGDTDDINYHGADPNKRGPKIINMLDPPSPAADLTQNEIFQIRRQQEVLPVDTSYWCTVHKAPSFNNIKHHVIAFNVTLSSQISIQHTHHLVLYICEPPAGETTEYFEQYLTHPGGECYDVNPIVPTNYCKNLLYIWAIGGDMLVLPEQTGFPIGDSGRQEYFMLEVHIDNPGLETTTFETGIDIFYTDKLRPLDAAVFGVGHAVSNLQIIPPRTKDFVNIGHCSADCTAPIPEEGITLINVMLHSHKAGTKIRTRIIRDGIELPWLAVDNHYNFDYQANRPFSEANYRKVFPGDHIITECTYDTTNRPNVTIGGHPSIYEMCQAWFWHYPRAFWFCESEAKLDLKDLFGIESLRENGDEPIITKPDAIAGRTFSEHLNTLNWTDDFKNKLQHELRYGPHESMCTGFPLIPVTYPKISQEYVEPDLCSRDGGGEDSGANFVKTFPLSAVLALVVTILFNF